MSGIKVLHAENKTLAIEGLKHILNCSKFAVQIQTIRDSNTLEVGLVAFEPDLLIIDYTIDSEFNVQDIEKSISNYPDIKVLVISDDDSQLQISKVIDLGIKGYLTRDCSIDELILTFKKLIEGGKYFCPKVVELLIKKPVFENYSHCSNITLTQREEQVVKNIALGLTNKKIGELLSISHHTVHTHRKNLMKKIGVKSSSELTLFAIDAGLIKLP